MDGSIEIHLDDNNNECDKEMEESSSLNKSIEKVGEKTEDDKNDAKSI
jgi:hypothetical protein